MKKRSVKSKSAANASSLSSSKNSPPGASEAVVGAILGGAIGSVIEGLGSLASGLADVSPHLASGDPSEKSVSHPPDKPARVISKKRKANPSGRTQIKKSIGSRNRRRR